VPVVNTFRIPTASMDVDTRSAGRYVRSGVISMLLCALVFACCFAIGRAERPAAAPAERLPPSLPSVSAGTAIPVALSGAPPIRVIQVKARTTVTQTASQSVLRATPIASSLPASLAPAAAAIPAPAVKAPIVKTPVRSTPESSNGSTGGTSTPPAAKGVSSPNGKPATKSETSSSTSFDSSG
jgi:hypothetical protein